MLQSRLSIPHVYWVWANSCIQHIFRNMRAGAEDMILNVIWPNVRKSLKDLPITLEIELYTLSLGQYLKPFLT